MKNNTKQRIETIIRLMLAFVVTFANFSFLPEVFANSYSKGEVINPTHSVGAENDVKLTKTVTNNGDGIYKVSLTAKGELKDITTVNPVYAVIVFDRSHSMICDDSKASYPVLTLEEGSHYKAADGQYLRCSLGKDTLLREKWENAVKGSIDFATEIVKNKNSKVSLVTFGTGADVTRNWENKTLEEEDFEHPYGLTYLAEGIERGIETLKNAPANAKKVMLIMTDGEATNKSNAEKRAQEAKNAGIAVYAIGYEVDSKVESFLKSIVGTKSSTTNDSDKYYKNSNQAQIIKVATDIAYSVKSVPAGTKATITDTIADGFTYVKGSANPDNAIIKDQTISFYIDNITPKGTTVNFKIKINKDLSDGLYKTNDLAKINYTNVQNIKEEKKITDSSKVYWEQEIYRYIINYYKDSVSGLNYINSEYGTNIFGYNVTIDDLTKINEFKPKGYKDGKIVTTNNTVSNDLNNPLIINVVYEKKDDLSYVVKYYKDTLNNNQISEDSDNTFENQVYKNSILESQINKDKYLPSIGYQSGVIETDMPYEIQDGENVIKVCYYKRTDMKYIVKYIEKGTSNEVLESTIVTDRTYEETYEETAKKAPYGYVLADDDKKSITVDADNKELIFNYEKRKDFSYTVKYLEKDTNITLSKEVERTKKTYNETYTETALSISGYNLVGDNTQSIKIDKENKEIVFYYTKKDNLSYTVNYYKDNITEENKFNSETMINQTFNSIIISDDINIVENTPYGYQTGVIITTMPYTIIDGKNIIDVLYSKRENMSYIVKYIDKETQEELNTLKRENKKYLETYTEIVDKEAIPFGYELVSESTQEILVDRDEKEVIFVFEKRKNFTYNVNYLEEETNIVLAPSKVEKNKKYLATYFEEALQIPGYDLVGEEIVEIKIDSEENEITFYYTKKTDLTYRVEYYYDGMIDSSKTELYENQVFGTVINNYIEKQPHGYKFISDTAPITLEDKEDNIIKVYYESIPQGDITPPKTGIETSNKYLSFIYLISTVGLVFIKRKQEN